MPLPAAPLSPLTHLIDMLPIPALRSPVPTLASFSFSARLPLRTAYASYPGVSSKLEILLPAQRFMASCPVRNRPRTVLLCRRRIHLPAEPAPPDLKGPAHDRERRFASRLNRMCASPSLRMSKRVPRDKMDEVLSKRVPRDKMDEVLRAQGLRVWGFPGPFIYHRA
jgi:hypothetical protein